MKQIKLEIYIGAGMLKGQGDDIVAVVCLPACVPKGQYDSSGKGVSMGMVGFQLLPLLGNYITDWIDFLEDEDKISAVIYLKKISHKKVFRGKQIVKVIDAMAQNDTRKGVDTFNDIQEIIK